MKKVDEQQIAYSLSPAQKKELEKRIAAHKSGTSKSFTLQEVREQMQEFRKSNQSVK